MVVNYLYLTVDYLFLMADYLVLTVDYLFLMADYLVLVVCFTENINTDSLYGSGESSTVDVYGNWTESRD